MFANRSVSRKPIDLNGVIRNVLDLVRTRLRDAGVQLQLELDESLPVIEADFWFAELESSRHGPIP